MRTPTGPFRGMWVFPAYAVTALLFFLPALLPGRQIFGTDYLGSTFIWETFASSVFSTGQLPAWLPHVYGGVPFFANPMDVYYPVSVVLRLLGLPIHLHLPLLFAIQFTIAGIGAYLLLKELGTRNLAAAVGGLLYMWNGFLVSLVYGGHDNRATVVSLLPVAFLAVHAAVRTGSPRWFGFLGLVIGCVLLPFQVQSSYYVLLACGLFFLFVLVQRGLHRRPVASLQRAAGGSTAVGIGLLLAAVNFLPFLGYLESSPRAADGGRGYDYSVTWSMPPEETAGVAVPERSGILGEYVGENPFKLHMEYAGALTLILCFIGGYLLKGRRLAWFFPILGALGLTLAFGGYTPLYRLYYSFLPGISLFRSPGSAFFLVNFALVIFGSLALDRVHHLTLERTRRGGAAEEPTGEEGLTDDALSELISSGSSLAIMAVIGIMSWAIWVTIRGGVGVNGAPTGASYGAGVWRFALFSGVVAVTLVLWLRGKVAPGLAGVTLLVVGGADLWIVDRQFLETVEEPSVYFAPDQVANFLAGREGAFRVDVLDDLPQDNYLTLFDIELVAGEHGNQIHSYNEFLGGTDSTYTDKRNLRLPQFRALANAIYTVTTDSTRVDLGDPVFRGQHRGRPATVYRDASILPRAFLVGGASRMDSQSELLAHMTNESFDPTLELLLYEDPPLPRPTRSGPIAGDVRIVERSPTAVRIAVDTPSEAYLALTDTYYPEWTVTVDGTPTPLLRAYHTFRAVAVPAGSHEVAFVFRSTRLRLGFWISVATWIALGAAGLATLRAGSRGTSTIPEAN